MILFEIKKIVSRTGSKIGLLVLMTTLVVTCYLAVTYTTYVDREGDEHKGIEAVKTLQKEKEEWTGVITEDYLKEVIRENNEINAKNLIDNIVSNLAILMELKNIEIITNVDEKATFIADYKWQQEALTNILKNAIEHSKHNSRIYITVENTNLFLKIIIKDEGSGIDKEDLKHIFQRFYKAKNSSENSIGIGLPLAKAIIEQSNGYIKVETKYGEGTSFEVKYIK